MKLSAALFFCKSKICNFKFNVFIEILFFMIVIDQLLRDGYQTFMDMAWISLDMAQI